MAKNSYKSTDFTHQVKNAATANTHTQPNTRNPQMDMSKMQNNTPPRRKRRKKHPQRRKKNNRKKY